MTQNDMDRLGVVLGEHLRVLRVARGWSQSDLADRLGALGAPMLYQTLAKIEKGTRQARADELLAFARAFGTTMAGLLGPIDDFFLASGVLSRNAALVDDPPAQSGARRRWGSEAVELMAQLPEGIGVAEIGNAVRSRLVERGQALPARSVVDAYLDLVEATNPGLGNALTEAVRTLGQITERVEQLEKRLAASDDGTLSATEHATVKKINEDGSVEIVEGE